MPFRNDNDAKSNRIRALKRELAAIQSQLQSNHTLKGRAKALGEEIETLEHEARKHRSLPLLKRVRVASPCHESWDDMSGDERARFCGRCEKSVFNLSGMTAADAEELLAAHGTSLCVRFYRRPDGTVMTADCPVGRGHARKQTIVAAALAGGVAAVTSGLAVAAALSISEAEPCVSVPAAIVETSTMGTPALPPDLLPVEMGDPDFAPDPPEQGKIAYPEIRGEVQFAQDEE